MREKLHLVRGYPSCEYNTNDQNIFFFNCVKMNRNVTSSKPEKYHDQKI